MVLEGNTIILLTVFPIVSGNPSFKKLSSHIMHTTYRYPGMHFVFVPPLFCGPQSGQRIWRRSYRLLPSRLSPTKNNEPSHPRRCSSFGTRGGMATSIPSPHHRSYPDKDVEGQFCYEYPAMPLQCSSDHHRLLGSRGVGGGVIERRA